MNLRKNIEYLEYLREREASVSIGASTARNMGPEGTIKVARKYLADLDLNRFLTNTQGEFNSELESATNEMMKRLPKGYRYWGSSRKFINIFLRGCCYNKYLYTHHNLKIIEPWLELPLDSHTVKGLKANTKRGELPRWLGVIHLTPEDSEIYQTRASKLAKSDGVNRVDLDIKFWRRMG